LCILSSCILSPMSKNSVLGELRVRRLAVSDIGYRQQNGVNCVLLCTVTDQLLRNVAINKPSSQISTYKDEYGQHPSSLANDGHRQTDYRDRTYGCAASNPETNPWWTVDLGVPTLVVQVNLTNRGDANGKIIVIIS